MAYLDELLQIYSAKKDEIERRLRDFRGVWDRDDRKIFAELCFCILTPQSKAQACDGIICKLENNGLLFKGSTRQLWPYLRYTRFYKNKSRYLLAARRLFSKDGKFALKDRIGARGSKKTRDWLVEHVKGIGLKEASHFLRNIGFGDELAILDIHILRNLKKLGVIKGLPKTLTKKRYLAIEKKVAQFSRAVNIPMAHLDLLLWSVGTGTIFK
jgi:N-glycosylase/DNA lyase